MVTPLGSKEKYFGRESAWSLTRKTTTRKFFILLVALGLWKMWKKFDLATWLFWSLLVVENLWKQALGFPHSTSTQLVFYSKPLVFHNFFDSFPQKSRFSTANLVLIILYSFIKMMPVLLVQVNWVWLSGILRAASQLMRSLSWRSVCAKVESLFCNWAILSQL